MNWAGNFSTAPTCLLRLSAKAYGCISRVPLQARGRSQSARRLSIGDSSPGVAAQPRIEGNPYVFTAARGAGPFNSFSEWKAQLDARLPAPLAHWTIHDLRRTARSLLSRAGVRPDISERVMGHAIPGVEGVYDRHRYDDEKAHALQALADLIDRILNPPATNVVPFRAGATS